MKSRKTSSIVLATLLVAGACFSTPALARDRHVVRDILLAPLLLPAAIVAATAPRPVIYEETYYVAPRRHVVHHRYAPRHNARPHRGYRDHGRHQRHYR